jgi:hypothetical protein
MEGPITRSATVLIVDCTLTDQAETQVVRLSRAQADRVSGRSGQVPVTNARVEILIDSSTSLVSQETTAGRYQLPTGFKGQPGHVYQLNFTLADGTRYVSLPETMQPVAPIKQVNARFNPASLSATERVNTIYTAAHDFYVDFTDPAGQPNYYRWEWIDWERQDWCRSCQGGLYQPTDENGTLVEDCVNDRFLHSKYDYNCRTQCWELIYSTTIVLLADRFVDGQQIKALRVGQVPLYSKEHCLVEIRQSSLTEQAYRYFSRLNEQTNTGGGVADSQPALLAGNVYNAAVSNEPVFGYFTVSSVTPVRYWLTRNDATGFTPGLFQALNGRTPVNEESVGRYRPPLAVCVPSDSRTPFRPIGWQD